MCVCGKRQKKSLEGEKGKITGVVPRKLQILFFQRIISREKKKNGKSRKLSSRFGFDCGTKREKKTENDN